MTAYVGRYVSGDFFRCPTGGDVSEAIEMCDHVVNCPFIITGPKGICFKSDPPDYTYTNWEGAILGEDANYRLDLQGKPHNVNVSAMVWQGVPPQAARPAHWAQWQLQFGPQGAERITKTKNARVPGYRTKFKGALAGVMMAMNRWISIQNFKDALQTSFEANANNGSTFGTVTSDVVWGYDLPRVVFHCSANSCDDDFTVVFANGSVRHRHIQNMPTIGLSRGMNAIYTAFRCPNCRTNTYVNIVRDLPNGQPFVGSYVEITT